MARTAVTVTTITAGTALAESAGTAADPTNDHVVTVNFPLEELLLALVERTVSLAHADRELEGELAQVRFAEFGCRSFQPETPEQHVLVKRDEIDLHLTAE